MFKILNKLKLISSIFWNGLRIYFLQYNSLALIFNIARYGSMEELKDLVGRFHDVGISVLGDVVLNHRCAHYKNGNGIWNIFGGRLNWDDRAVVADDPHFQVMIYLGYDFIAVLSGPFLLMVLMLLIV